MQPYVHASRPDQAARTHKQGMGIPVTSLFSHGCTSDANPECVKSVFKNTWENFSVLDSQTYIQCAHAQQNITRAVEHKAYKEFSHKEEQGKDILISQHTTNGEM
jgi:hypothetical protein